MLIERWCAGLDEVLAPIIATLDCLPDYFHPATTPDDALGWLAGWIGLRLVDRQPRQRELVAAGVNMLRCDQGTARRRCGDLRERRQQVVDLTGKPVAR